MTPPRRSPQPHPGPDAPRCRGLAALLIVAFLLPAMWLWAIGWTRGRAACDQYEYHLKAILKFAAELPRPDLHDYLSATTPGYHLLVAAAARLVSPNPIFLQVAAALFTVGLLALLARMICRAGQDRGRTWLELAALALPVVASPYVFTSGVWLLPDNAGWLLALIVVMTSVRSRQTSNTLMFGGLALAVLVLMRQSHAWAAAPLLAAGWMSSTQLSDARLAGALQQPARRLSMTLVATLVCIPAALILAAFARLWHGLTPPFFHEQHLVKGHSIINWATVPFILSLIGLFSLFFLGWLWTGVARAWRASRLTLVLIALATIAWAAIPETTFMREPRSGGLWGVVEKMESAGLSIAHHTSPLLLLLAPLGAVMLAGWLMLIDDKRRWIIGAAVAAFVAAQSANANCWQRYYEPFLLMLFALLAARYGASAIDSGTSRRGSWLAAWRLIGPVLLTLLLGIITIGGLITGRDPLHPDPEQPAVSMPRDPIR